MSALISICIPTFNRPALLKLAIESCLQQVYRPIEILIGDDSNKDDSEIVASSMRMPEGVTLQYFRNCPAGGQAANVNGLFDRAVGDRLLLLHDDDVLCANAIETLAGAWDRSPNATCVYGKQAVIDAGGQELDRESAAWNERYFRVSEHAGPQRSPLVAALWQQVPNDCYLVDTKLARRTRYKSEIEVGQCVDAEFALRLARHVAERSFVFVDALISQYRLTPASIARSKTLNRRQDLFFDIVQGVEGDANVERAKSILLSRIGVGAALDAALAARRMFAIRVIFSRHYGRPLLSRWTVYRLLCAAAPSLGPHVKRLIDGRTPSEATQSGPPVEPYGTRSKRAGKTMSQS